MGIVTLKITKPPGRDYFTSAETISGTVELHTNRASTISRITVYLEGKLKTAVRQLGGCQESFSKGERLLFSHQQVVSPPLGESLERQRDAPGYQQRVLPFALEFPALVVDGLANAQHQKLGLAGLPPSISIASDGLRISVTYTVRVVVERVGAFHLNNKTRCDVAFRPLSGPQACIDTHTSLLKTTNFLSTASLGLKGPALHGGNELPAYSPAIQFEVEIPQCKTIFPGEHIQLGLSFVIPNELRHLFSVIWVSSIRIRLKAITTAAISSHKRASTEYIECCHIEGSMPFRLPATGSQIAIPSELWQYHTYPQLLPSFQLAEVQRKHQLEVVVEFAWMYMKNVYRVMNCNEVIVESDAQLPCEAPPSYD